MGNLRGQQPGVLVPLRAGFREGLQSLESAGVQVTHQPSRGIDLVIALHAAPPSGVVLTFSPSIILDGNISVFGGSTGNSDCAQAG
jgi:hypothetical protein